MSALPLQVIDNFLLNYNVGDVLLLVVVVASIGALVAQRSTKIFGLQLITFGLLFLVLPEGTIEPATSSIFPQAAFYKLVGLALLVLAPVIYAVGRR